ncbi:putative ATP adenylyltransferase [Prochlorococcus sp. MIT 0801]|nr:putative ATP adenylyltransferase [Prochlorococcus sp. MIT 0801]
MKVKSELIWSKALETSRKAIECAAVIPLETYKYKSIKRIFDYELRFLKRTFPKNLVDYGPKENPFIPWDRRLEVQAVNDNYTLILNKYPVQLGHLLLITNYWKPQNSWLNIGDFEAISKVDNDTTGLWFFNSSKEAGASQPHRHFQLLRRHTYENICPRYDWFCSLLNNSEDFNSDIKQSISIKPRMSKSEIDANDLFNSYKSMIIEMDLGDINNDDKPIKPYNLLITKRWISLIVRSKDRSHGFNINALGFAGYFLGTKRSDIDMLIKFGPESILKHVI